MTAQRRSDALRFGLRPPLRAPERRWLHLSRGRDLGVLRTPPPLSLYLKIHRADCYSSCRKFARMAIGRAGLSFSKGSWGNRESSKRPCEAQGFYEGLQIDRAGLALRIHDLLQLHPFATVYDLVARPGRALRPSTRRWLLWSAWAVAAAVTLGVTCAETAQEIF
jgi:hypothetical protein